MTNVTRKKWLRCIPLPEDSPDHQAVLDTLETRLPLQPSHLTSRILDVVGEDQELLTLHGMPPRLPARYAIASWEWSEASGTWTGERHSDHLYRVTERPVFDELPARDADGWRPGVKQLSFLRRPSNVSRDEFRELYFHHTEKLRDDQPGIAKYVQNVVEEISGDAPDLDGISELWFASLDDFRDRYWSGPGVAEREAEETSRFLDFSRTWSLIVRERLPRTP